MDASDVRRLRGDTVDGTPLAMVPLITRIRLRAPLEAPQPGALSLDPGL